MLEFEFIVCDFSSREKDRNPLEIAINKNLTRKFYDRLLLFIADAPAKG